MSAEEVVETNVEERSLKHRAPDGDVWGGRWSMDRHFESDLELRGSMRWVLAV